MTQQVFAICDGVHAPVTEGAVMAMSNCRKGDLSEALFIAGCIVHGWETFKAFGHDHTADWVLVRGAYRVKVQVKTASHDRGDYSICVKRGRGVNLRAYAEGDFDVLAAYLPDRNQFVFWSFADICSRKKVRYSPARHRQPGNWGLLDDVAKSLTEFQA